MKIQQNKSVIITAIICITAMESVALGKGVNGVMFASTLALIAGILGVALPSKLLIK